MSLKKETGLTVDTGEQPSGEAEGLDMWAARMTAFETHAERPRVTFKKAWGHLKTICRHKAIVARYCFALGLYWQGITHDLSKFSYTEFIAGARYFQGFRSPNAAERAEVGYSSAWLHHKGRNRHHFEYWIDVRGNADVTLAGMPMPTRYVVEMFCDRVAACRVYKGEAYTDRSALEYYELEHSSGDVLMHPDTDALLKRMIDLLAEKGEKEALAQIRDCIVKPRLVVGQGGRY